MDKTSTKHRPKRSANRSLRGKEHDMYVAQEEHARQQEEDEVQSKRRRGDEEGNRHQDNDTDVEQAGGGGEPQPGCSFWSTTSRSTQGSGEAVWQNMFQTILDRSAQQMDLVTSMVTNMQSWMQTQQESTQNFMVQILSQQQQQQQPIQQQQQQQPQVVVTQPQNQQVTTAQPRSGGIPASGGGGLALGVQTAPVMLVMKLEHLRVDHRQNCCG